MEHLVLLLYLISGFSGLISFVYLKVKIGSAHPYMKAYMPVHLSYTLIQLAALLLLYLRVNVLPHSEASVLLISVILAGMGLLGFNLVPLDSFNRGREREEVSGLTRWSILSFYIGLAILYWKLRHRRLSLLPLVLGVGLFLLFTITALMVDKKRSGNALARSKVRWLYFVIITLAIIGAELFLKSLYGFLGEYSLNIPFIFLLWNFLTLKELHERFVFPDKGLILDGEIPEIHGLTAREREISQAVIRGDSNKEIAYELGISSSTVKNHIYSIYKKTGARGRVDLINVFMKMK